MTDTSNDTDSGSEVFRYGGSGTLLLIGLLLFVGLHPLMLGGFASRVVGGLLDHGHSDRRHHRRQQFARGSGGSAPRSVCSHSASRSPG